MKTFQTNAGLGYQQFAFLIRLDKTDNGYNYLCIGTKNVHTDTDTEYWTGAVVELEDIYIEDSTFQVSDSELNGTYLFNYWINNYYAEIESQGAKK